MTAFLFANDAQTTLAAPLSAAATSVILAAGTGTLFPNPGAGEQFALTLVDAATRLVKEIVYCTARVVDTLTIVRAQEGTAAQDWAAGDIAANLNTAGTMRAFNQTAASSGVLLSTQILTASQTPTYPAGTATVDIELVGGGASGGGTPVTGAGEAVASSGGGAAAFIKAIFSIAAVTGQALVIGGGAAPGVAGVDGINGNPSSFGGTLLVAPGGRAGLAGNVDSAPHVTGPNSNTAAPTASGYDTLVVATPGSEGGYGVSMGPSNSQSGPGGPSVYGPGGPSIGNTGPGVIGPSPGSGGSGASALENATATVGGGGANGQCIIRSYS